MESTDHVTDWTYTAAVICCICSTTAVVRVFSPAELHTLLKLVMLVHLARMP